MTGALTLAAAVLELIMAFALNRIEGFVSAEPVLYIIKYLITPVTINCVLVLVGMLAMKSRWLSRQTRRPWFLFVWRASAWCCMKCTVCFRR